MKHHRLEIHLDRPHCPQFLCLVNIFLLHLLILSLALTLHVIQQILRALATKGNPGKSRDFQNFPGFKNGRLKGGIPGEQPVQGEARASGQTDRARHVSAIYVR